MRGDYADRTAKAKADEEGGIEKNHGTWVKRALGNPLFGVIYFFQGIIASKRFCESRTTSRVG